MAAAGGGGGVGVEPLLHDARKAAGRGGVLRDERFEKFIEESVADIAAHHVATGRRIPIDVESEIRDCYSRTYVIVAHAYAAVTLLGSSAVDGVAHLVAVETAGKYGVLVRTVVKTTMGPPALGGVVPRVLIAAAKADDQDHDLMSVKTELADQPSDQPIVDQEMKTVGFTPCVLIKTDELQKMLAEDKAIADSVIAHKEEVLAQKDALIHELVNDVNGANATVLQLRDTLRNIEGLIAAHLNAPNGCEPGTVL
eukprot:gene114-7365_t